MIVITHLFTRQSVSLLLMNHRSVLTVLEVGFHRVVAGAVANSVSCRVWRAHNLDLDAAEFRERVVFRWVVRQQVLRAQFVADFVEGVIELSNRRRVIVSPG